MDSAAAREQLHNQVGEHRVGVFLDYENDTRKTTFRVIPSSWTLRTGSRDMLGDRHVANSMVCRC